MLVGVAWCIGVMSHSSIKVIGHKCHVVMGKGRGLGAGYSTNQ